MKKSSILLILSLFTITITSHAQSAVIPIVVESNIEVYNDEGADILKGLEITAKIQNSFENLNGVEIRGDDANEDEGLFLLTFNISKVPESEWYTLTYLEMVNMNCEPDNPDSESNVWALRDNVHLVVENPLEVIESISIAFEEIRVRPFLQIFNQE